MLDDDDVVYSFELTKQDIEKIMDDEDATIIEEVCEALDYVLYNCASKWLRENMEDIMNFDDDPQ